MVRWVVRLVGLGILLAAVTLPGVIGSVGSDIAPAYEETTISKYVASFDLDDRGERDRDRRLVDRGRSADALAWLGASAYPPPATAK